MSTKLHTLAKRLAPKDDTNKIKKGLWIAIDFDGTIVTHEYPKIGDLVPYGLAVLYLMQASGARLLLNTMRSNKRLQEAIDFVKEHGIEFVDHNKNPEQHDWTESPKCYAHAYIDDASVGCPLIKVPDTRPYVDWQQIAEHFGLDHAIDEMDEALIEEFQEAAKLKETDNE